jgi:hypothetical protein
VLPTTLDLRGGVGDIEHYSMETIKAEIKQKITPIIKEQYKHCIRVD